MREFNSLEELRTAVGQEIAVSDWMVIDQARIDLFAEATGDRQWLHVDPLRAAQGPYGKTIAHGYLTLSLIPFLAERTITVGKVRMNVNYGLNKVRFPTPVPVDSRLRARIRLTAMDPLPDSGEGQGYQLVLVVTVEREGSDKPACVAELVSRRYGDSR
jgi:acyl dehydratase